MFSIGARGIKGEFIAWMIKGMRFIDFLLQPVELFGVANGCQKNNFIFRYQKYRNDD